MSRMMSYVARVPLPGSAAFGHDLLSQFAALARLHADGWGTAWLDPDTSTVHTTGSPTSLENASRLSEILSMPSRARTVYLRFASRGAPASPENIQPFLRDGVAFQHNGLITPRAEALALLEDRDGDRLRGTTDSEVYFAILRQRTLSTVDPSEIDAVARRVGDIRRRFPAACLNAMLLSASGLYVVHAAGRMTAPLDSFARRGADLAALPPGHDHDYNVLRATTTPTGARVVATTGVDQRGWVRLSDEHVFAVTADGVRGTPVTHEPPPVKARPSRGART